MSRISPPLTTSMAGPLTTPSDPLIFSLVGSSVVIGSGSDMVGRSLSFRACSVPPWASSERRHRTSCAVLERDQEKLGVLEVGRIARIGTRRHRPHLHRREAGALGEQ